MKEKAIEYFKFYRKKFCEDHLKILPKDSIAYQATLKEKEFHDIAIKALEQQPCEDCISRSQALKEMEESAKHHANDSREEVLLRRDRDIIRALPPVKPQEPKTGHWIMTNDYFTGAYESIDYVKCSCCGEDSLEEGNYCPNCGAKME